MNNFGKIEQFIKFRCTIEKQTFFIVLIFEAKLILIIYTFLGVNILVNIKKI